MDLLADVLSVARIRATTVAHAPFVANDVVSAEVVELLPNKADPRLAFLLP